VDRRATLSFLPAVSLTTLIFATVLAVAKSVGGDALICRDRLPRTVMGASGPAGVASGMTGRPPT